MLASMAQTESHRSNGKRSQRLRQPPPSVVMGSVAISNYRSCIDTVIDLQPDLSVLIGPNGSGKTNILSACLLLRALAAEREDFQRAPVSAKTQTPRHQCTLKVSFKCTSAIDERTRKTILTAALRINTDRNNRDRTSADGVFPEQISKLKELAHRSIH